MNYQLMRTSSRAVAVAAADVKVHIVDPNAAAAVLQALTLTVMDMLEPPNGWLGRALALADYRLLLKKFDDPIWIPAPPYASLTSFQYYDEAGDLQTVDSDLYRIVVDDIARVEQVKNAVWPTIITDREYPIILNYKAGYATAAAVPDAIRQFMMIMVAHLYDNRGLTNLTATHVTPYVWNMIEGWRVRL